MLFTTEKSKFGTHVRILAILTVVFAVFELVSVDIHTWMKTSVSHDSDFTESNDACPLRAPKGTIVRAKEKSADFAILFSALARSLKFTLDSLHENLFDVLTEHNITYHTYIHSYTLNRPYYSYRDGLFNLSINLTQYKMLNADFELPADDQDEIGVMLNFSSYRTNRNGWGPTRPWDWTDHLILALYSQYLATLQLRDNILIHHYSYKYVMFIRPDLWVIDPININSYLRVLNSSDRVVLSPDTEKRGKKNEDFPDYPQVPLIDDKIAMCKVDLCIEFGMGFPYLKKYSQDWPVTSENWKSFLITRILNATTADVKLKYFLVRPDGRADGWESCLRIRDKKRRESLKPCKLMWQRRLEHQRQKREARAASKAKKNCELKDIDIIDRNNSDSDIAIDTPLQTMIR